MRQVNTDVMRSALWVVSVTTLIGCNSAEPDTHVQSPVLGAALAEHSTPYQPQPFNDTNYVGTSDQELGYLAQVPETLTAAMYTSNDFAFTTSHIQPVSFSLPEMSTQQAEATFCTEYKMQSTGDYSVNYNSCVLSAPVLGGSLNEELKLVNQHQSVIGVVSFQDPNIQPIYQEFHFD